MRVGGWGLELVCGCYLLIVCITSRGLIAAPRYRLFQARLRDCRARADYLGGVWGEGSPQQAVVGAVAGRLGQLEQGGTVVWRLSARYGVIAIPLSKLAAACRVLHAAERRLLGVEPDEEVLAQRESLVLRLRASGEPADEEMADRVAAADVGAVAGRALVVAAAQRLDDAEDGAAERDYDQQRIALWLALTGLCAILLTGRVLDHRETMLLGALGGFLSPVVGVLRAQRPPSSWGVLVLAPVGGALAAVGGLLLVRMLADPELNLLGQVFLENSWSTPDRPIALAIALLFGFSGQLFSRLALTATGQLTAPAPGPRAV
ncbi:hypothetical protein U5640_30425 [Streptomyces sp. SS7]|uniref:hypothetical protein n=1 Tax=Streptomyces sp. SS7 TaxID=3108485 RepID=UPI0030EF1883